MLLRPPGCLESKRSSTQFPNVLGAVDPGGADKGERLVEHPLRIATELHRRHPEVELHHALADALQESGAETHVAPPSSAPARTPWSA